MASTIELPNFKGRPGWEFTDLSALDLDSYRHAPAVLSYLGPPTPTAPASGSLWDLPTPALPEGVEVAADGDITVVTVARGVHVADPIPLTVVLAESGTIVNQHTRVVLEEGAQAEVWEQFLSQSDDLDGVLNLRTELILGDNSRLRYVSGQNLSEQSWVFGAQRAEVGRDATLDWVALGFGSRSGHVLMETRLAGQGAEARVTGAYATHGRQHIDFDTTQEHAAENTTSDLAFRGVLQDRSSAVWKGNIIVDPGAQKTDAFQDSRNLLISKRAHADAIPGLEIQANDVRCTHAAAVAQVDPEQLFYLRSHGLPEAEAKQLVIEGFLSALVERFEVGPVRDVLAAALERRLAIILD
ncbi:MAG TPA: Fe-S cluster assembly protein SufD [Solirubrobacteraceae bacterium]|nr:Fe-S cluster assembly protein SufD [Solirubrobacteraceae bacterium]